ncbi:MAG TPA: MBL fold metallo-hydrolase [Bacillota bacterium]|jgi:glyoxylase-like metal-dependent hydrolase (beta-lactamase superfamily II)|nr:MBL fold metallo-hydrolase [Bacillota bacterium]HOB86278.1 MBL fold metallo-hydrolase [Bacillota bacterium]HOP69567.1 MBL fold metallo-hydrolase [Bacillota bacterium]HPT34176.1 MBL fold metallo-hydrolase [Bacillota bacterium]HQD05973.1 MBL fold metallo-hydrolase [Bacillota bacterium]
MKIADQIYGYFWRGRGNNCNSYLIAGEKNILIDPGHVFNEFGENCLQMLARELNRDGFNFEDIDLILCTHGHPDHSQGAGLVRKAGDALMAIHELEEPFLQAAADYLQSRGVEEGDASLAPDFYLQEGELLAGREKALSLKVIHTPGHSPGAVCFYLPEPGVLFSGDTVFRSSIGRHDLPGGSLEELKASIDKLAQLDPVELLLPGHMGMVAGKERVQENFRLVKAFFF